MVFLTLGNKSCCNNQNGNNTTIWIAPRCFLIDAQNSNHQNLVHGILICAHCGWNTLVVVCMICYVTPLNFILLDLQIARERLWFKCFYKIILSKSFHFEVRIWTKEKFFVVIITNSNDQYSSMQIVYIM